MSNTNLTQKLLENKGQNDLGTKIWKDITRRIIIANLSPKYRFKNPKQNINKVDATISKTIN